MLRPTFGGTVVAGWVAGVAEPLLAVVAVAVRAAVVAVLPPPTDVAAASVDPVVAAAVVDVSASAVVDVAVLAGAVVVVVRSDAETDPAFFELPPQPAATMPKSATGMATRR